MKTNIIDCTFLDGGYYNNWNFSNQLIKKYLSLIADSEIKYCEIGFYSIPEDPSKGITCNCDKFFFSRFKIPDTLKIGVMINASDLLNSVLSKKKNYFILIEFQKNTFFL